MCLKISTKRTIEKKTWIIFWINSEFWKVCIKHINKQQAVSISSNLGILLKKDYATDRIFISFDRNAVYFSKVKIQSFYFLISSGGMQFTIFELTLQLELKRRFEAGIFLTWTTGIFLFLSEILSSKDLILKYNFENDFHLIHKEDSRHLQNYWS